MPKTIDAAQILHLHQSMESGYSFSNEDIETIQDLMHYVSLYKDACRQLKLQDIRIRDLELLRFRTFSDEECWIYQEGEDNYLESLVCPVVINPKVLIDIEKKYKTLEGVLIEIKPCLGGSVIPHYGLASDLVNEVLEENK